MDIVDLLFMKMIDSMQFIWLIYILFIYYTRLKIICHSFHTSYSDNTHLDKACHRSLFNILQY